jgi:hypothetical protein
LGLHSLIGGGSKCRVECHKAIQRETESRWREIYGTEIRKEGTKEQKVLQIRTKEGQNRYQQSTTKRQIRNGKKGRAKKTMKRRRRRNCDTDRAV